MNHRFDTFMDFEQSQGSGWLVGYLRTCGHLSQVLEFDLHIFYDKDKEKVVI